jgi:predicted O-linked N-acetylglucosamine transferase (SPINDLY family)
VPKLSPPTIALWARLLERVSGSRLLLKAYNLGDPAVVDVVRRRFVAAGVASSRLIFVGALTDPAEHFRAIGEIDVALDPFPFNGSTTTFEALWMGVPVVTLLGERMAGRWTASMLHALGLDALIAGDRERYLQAAAALVADSATLDRHRRDLRARLKSSPLMDGRARARQLERVYRTLVRRSRR